MINFWQLLLILAVTNAVTGLSVGLFAGNSKVKVKKNSLSDNATISAIGRIFKRKKQ